MNHGVQVNALSEPWDALIILQWIAGEHGSSTGGMALFGARYRVGSHAREEVRPDSDLDSVRLCTAPHAFLADTAWIHHFGAVETCHTEEWGVVISLRVYDTEGFAGEFGLTTPMWASLPVDPGTKHVAAHGIRMLCDRDGLLGRLRAAVAAS